MFRKLFQNRAKFTTIRYISLCTTTAESRQLNANLAHVTKKQTKKYKKLKETNASAHLVQSKFKISERSP